MMRIYILPVKASLQKDCFAIDSVTGHTDQKLDIGSRLCNVSALRSRYSRKPISATVSPNESQSEGSLIID